MRRLPAYLSLLVSGLLALVACGAAGLGETCDKEGATDPCDDGLVCGKEVDSSLRCQKLCTVQTDCAATEECNGMSGSLKGCRAKK